MSRWRGTICVENLSKESAGESLITLRGGVDYRCLCESGIETPSGDGARVLPDWVSRRRGTGSRTHNAPVFQLLIVELVRSVCSPVRSVSYSFPEHAA